MPSEKIPYVSEVPELMKIWSKSGNRPGLAAQTPANSKDVVAKWICPNCGTEFKKCVRDVYHGGIMCRTCTSNKNAYDAIDKKIREQGSILDHYPYLEKYWDYEENKKYPHKGRYLPSQFLPKSNVKVYWKCPDCSYKWKLPIITVTSRKFPCQKCLKNDYSSKVFGSEPISQTHPDIMKFWDNDNTVSKDKITAHDSITKILWVCPRGHHFTKDPNYFIYTLKGNCPTCQKESQTSFPEQAIYFYLSKVTKAENRAKINEEEIDVYLPDLHIGVEYDGKRWHEEKDQKEIEKEMKLNSFGIRIIRIKERCPKHPESAKNVIFVENKSHKELERVIRLLFKELGLPHERIDIDKDEIAIKNQYIASIKKNSIVHTHPQLAKEWDHEKNENLNPEYFSIGSKTVVWWKCDKGHEWQDSIISRKNNGCPYCLGKKCIPGENDLATKNPELLEEWDYEKNIKIGLTPETVTSDAKKKAYWICKRCGNPWQKSIYSRTVKGKGCPKCSHKRRYTTRLSNLIAKKGSFAENYPDLLKEWDYEENKGIDPYKIATQSKEEVGWICQTCGYHWKATVDSRVGKNSGCKVCYRNGLKKAQQQRAVKEKGSVADLKPDLVLDWASNNEYRPEELCIGSHEKINWKCHLCGYEWINSVENRAKRNQRCPECKGKGPTSSSII